MQVFISPRPSDRLGGDARGGRSMEDKHIPTVHCPGQRHHHLEMAKSSKLPFMITIPGIIPCDDDLQMSACVCVRLRDCVCLCASVCVRDCVCVGVCD